MTVLGLCAGFVGFVIGGGVGYVRGWHVGWDDSSFRFFKPETYPDGSVTVEHSKGQHKTAGEIADSIQYLTGLIRAVDDKYKGLPKLVDAVNALCEFSDERLTRLNERIAKLEGRCEGPANKESSPFYWSDKTTRRKPKRRGT